jgi:hypothetical protein
MQKKSTCVIEARGLVRVEALAPAVVAVVVEAEVAAVVVAAVPVPVEPGWEEAGVVPESAPARQGPQERRAQRKSRDLCAGKARPSAA